METYLVLLLVPVLATVAISCPSPMEVTLDSSDFISQPQQEISGTCVEGKAATHETSLCSVQVFNWRKFAF